MDDGGQELTDMLSEFESLDNSVIHAAIAWVQSRSIYADERLIVAVEELEEFRRQVGE